MAGRRMLFVLTLIGLFLFVVSVHSGLAGVKTVRLTVPNCSS